MIYPTLCHVSVIPAKDACIIFHKHKASHPYHKHGKSENLRQGIRRIKGHDVFQMNGRNGLAPKGHKCFYEENRCKLIILSRCGKWKTGFCSVVSGRMDTTGRKYQKKNINSFLFPLRMAKIPDFADWVFARQELRFLQW